MKTNTRVLSGEIATAVGKMVEAVTMEAKARKDAEATITKASDAAFATCRDTILGILKDKLDGVKNAKLALEALRTAAKANDDLKRGIQYASDLSRAVRAVEAGKAIPAKLAKAGRTAWCEADFWRDAGILNARKPRAGEGNKDSGNKDSDDAADKAMDSKAGETAGAKLAKVAGTLVEDAALNGILAKLAGLEGPFRAEAYREVSAVLDRITAKQAQAKQAA